MNQPIETIFFSNSNLVMERFGKWPSFHDAEILRVELWRNPDVRQNPSAILRMDIYVFEVSPDLDERGYFRLENESVICLLFNGVEDLKIADFNYQNVIQELSCSKLKNGRLAFEIYSSFGLSGSFSCIEAEVTEVRPWNSG
jgi:hypothetical protein